MSKMIQVSPSPPCPECGGRMVLRKPKPGQDWEPFWGCSRYPACRGTCQPVYKHEAQLALFDDKEVRYERI